MGFGHRNCAVVGCLNSGKKSDKWLLSKCSFHDCDRTSKKCDCKQPFKLFPFPSKLKNNEARLR